MSTQLIPQLIELYHNGKFPVEKLAKVYAIDQLDKAIDDMKSGKVS
jgi:Zn-dependent alcohol dehydrogenase